MHHKNQGQDVDLGNSGKSTSADALELSGQDVLVTSVESSVLSNVNLSINISISVPFDQVPEFGDDLGKQISILIGQLPDSPPS